jgi:integrase
MTTTNATARRVTPKGIAITPHGYRATFRKDGQLHSKRFALRDYRDATDPAKIALRDAVDWMNAEKARLTLKLPPLDPKATRFEQDASTYLDAVTSMPSYSDREYHIGQWAAVFKGRDRQTVTALEIRTQLERWRQTLSASSCNKRRTALMSFYTRLNGKSGYNPVRDVEKYAEEEEPRAQHPVTIYRILALMRPSKTRARLRVILTTGWPHAQVKRLKPEHLDLQNARAWVTPRRKGKGRKGGWLPLLPAAVTALKEFQQWAAFGEFSNSSMHSRFAHALGKLNAHRQRLKLPTLSVHPYDLRHSFGTAVAHRITDERALQELMMHSRIEQTRRYTESATAGRVERAIWQLLATRTAAQPVSSLVQTDKRKAKRARKAQKVKRARQDSNLRPPA